jgi:hypothetical protein
MIEPDFQQEELQNDEQNAGRGGGNAGHSLDGGRRNANPDDGTHESDRNTGKPNPGTLKPQKLGRSKRITRLGKLAAERRYQPSHSGFKGGSNLPNTLTRIASERPVLHLLKGPVSKIT